MSLTPYEKFKLSGSFDPREVENILELNDVLASTIEDIGSDILCDASTAIIKEDCLQEEIDTLKQIIVDMGTSKFKKTLLEFVEQLEEKQQEMGQQGEYAAEEIKAVKDRWVSVYNLV